MEVVPLLLLITYAKLKWSSCLVIFAKYSHQKQRNNFVQPYFKQCNSLLIAVTYYIATLHFEVTNNILHVTLLSLNFHKS